MLPSSCLAVARITKSQSPQGRFRITFSGDGLALLHAPGPVLLYHAPSGEGMFAPSERGLSDNGRLVSAQLKRVRSASGSGSVDLCTVAGEFFQDEEIVGAWLCLPKSALEKQADELFVYQLLGMGVARAEDPEGAVTGQISGYFENGAHGIIEVRLESGQQALIPLVSAYCKMDHAAALVRVSMLDDFLT